METIEKTYDIKIPVYVSECITLENQSLFSTTPDTLLANAKTNLANYNDNPNSLVYIHISGSFKSR